MNGDEIRAIRYKLGLSQSALAETLGVHIRTIQNWEKTGKISHEDYTKLCGLLPQPCAGQQYYGGNIEQANVNGDNIRKSEAEVSRLLSLLEAKERSLAKSQEQIDKLIAVIGNLTNTTRYEKENKGE